MLFVKNKVASISASELDTLLPDISLIDIREPYEVLQRSVQGAKNIPMETLLRNPQNYLNKDETYYIICQSGMRSQRTTAMLAKQGYHVINVEGGVGAYHGKYVK